MKKVISQLEKSENINIENYLDNGRIEVDTEEVIETKDFQIKFRLETSIIISYGRGSHYQPPEMNVVKEEINISEIEVFDYDGQENIILSGKEYDNIVATIKDKIEY